MNPSSLFISTPAHLLSMRLPLLLHRKLQPEVACQEVTLQKLDFEQLGDCAEQLYTQGLRTTLHAPFNDFHPGSSEKRLRKTAVEIATGSLKLAAKLRARRIVFHPGMALGSSHKEIDLWLLNNLAFWPEFLEQADTIDCTICIENIFETTPDIFITLFQTINSPHLGHVFDIGHWNIFSSCTLLDWLDATAPFLQHLHLHDNRGVHDDHLPMGRGSVPFTPLFKWLRTMDSAPTITLENRHLPDIEYSLKAIQNYLQE